ERFEEGMAEYRAALQLKEAKPSTARNAGVAKIRANLANALAITANHLSESAPTVPAEAMRRYDEAIRQYQEALELDPQQPAIHRNLGMLLAQLGRYDEAIAHLRATLQMVPNEPVARETLDAIEASHRETIPFLDLPPSAATDRTSRCRTQYELSVPRGQRHCPNRQTFRR